MASKHPLTPTGLKIRHKLVDMDVSMAEFCREHGIIVNNLCTALRSNELHRNLLKRVCEILDIEYVG